MTFAELNLEKDIKYKLIYLQNIDTIIILRFKA